MLVYFNNNAWVDTPTHLHGLARFIVPINEHLGEVKIRGVQIEDNLFFHQVEKVLAFWSDMLEHFDLLPYVDRKSVVW